VQCGMMNVELFRRRGEGWGDEEGAGSPRAGKWGLTLLLVPAGKRIQELERKGMPRKGKTK
jgi:hypothetical protein